MLDSRHETFSICNQHINFTVTNSQEFHACISYMPAQVLGNDIHVRATKNNFKQFPTIANMHFLQLLIREKYRSCMYLYCPRWYWRYTSNLYRSTPHICNSVPRWLLSFGERETPQYTSNLCCSTPLICTAVPFVPVILLRKYQG